MAGCPGKNRGVISYYRIILGPSENHGVNYVFSRVHIPYIWGTVNLFL